MTYTTSSAPRLTPEVAERSIGSVGRPSAESWMMPVTDRIETNPNVMLGKPVVRGTRVPVALILRKLGEGATEAELLDAYPRLTSEDIRAALTYAADTVAHE